MSPAITITAALTVSLRRPVREVDDRFDLIGVGPVALDQLLPLVVVAHVSECDDAADLVLHEPSRLHGEPAPGRRGRSLRGSASVR
jgi:hypothetical protein